MISTLRPLTAAAFLLLGTACAEEDQSETTGDGWGEVAFWTSFSQCGEVTHDFCVSLDGDQSCSSPQDSEPECGSGATAHFSVSAGSHGYEADIYAGDLDDTWSGTATVSDGECTLIQLYCD